MKIWHILLHKGLGLSAGLINVLIAASVLSPQTSYLYLTILSASQIFMAFSGFGLSHRLVTLPQDEARKQKAWPWFALTQLAGLVVFMWLAKQSQVETPYRVVVFTGMLLLLLLMAEWMRTAMARQTGFIIYNLVLLSTAPAIAWQEDITPIIALFPLAGCGALLWAGRDFYRLSGSPIRPKMADLIRACRVASVNQYYNLVILLFPLFGMRAEVVGLIVVFRFAIFYNWPNFFWLRFGHKQLAGQVTPEHFIQNRKLITVNLVAFAGTVIAIIAAIHFELFTHIPSGIIDRDFAILLLFFAGLRITVNLYFPYEVFLVYRFDLRLDLLMLGTTLGSLVFLGALISIMQNPYIVILFVELVWLSWRLLSHKVLRGEH